MANDLDELTGPINEEGRDINVINKQLPVKVGVGSTIFQVILWVLGIIPGVVFLIMKVRAGSYLRMLQQRIQHDASQIDNYLEQRVVILQNTAKLIEKAVALDQDTFSALAAYRSGVSVSTDGDRIKVAEDAEAVSAKVRMTMENYPQLQAHSEINEGLKQNAYLQKEITAAREIYNDSVNQWNRDINAWPTKMIVAAKQGYTTRIPFITSKAIKEQARGVFF